MIYAALRRRWWFIALLVALVPPSANATPLDGLPPRFFPPWVRHAPRTPRVRANVARTFALPRPAQAGEGWTITDLAAAPSVCAFGAGCRPVAASATSVKPFAINAAGDIAVTQCGPTWCTAAVYDHRVRTLLPLASFPAAPAGATEIYFPTALNDRGEVVGSYIVTTKAASAYGRPVVWQRRGLVGSTIAYLDADPRNRGSAYGVNNAGVAVGSEAPTTAGFSEHAVRFTAGAPVALDQNAPSDAYAIDDAGIIAGESVGFAVAYIGSTIDVVPPADQCPQPYDQCDENLALAVNAGGTVLGNYVTNFFDLATQSYVGFFFSPSNNGFGNVPQPACFDNDCPVQYSYSDQEYVVALNDADDFVGEFDGSPWVSFSPVGDANGLLVPGSGWQIVSVTGINDRRQIIGQGYRAGYGNALRAFVLSPPS